MSRAEDLERIVVAAHALTRIAAWRTGNDAPAAQWRALSALTGGPLRLGDLARRTRTTQPGMTRLARQLDEEGLIARGNDPEDSRATVLSLTDAGETALRAWRVQLSEALEPLFADLDEDEWDTLARASVLLDTRIVEPTGARS